MESDATQNAKPRRRDWRTQVRERDWSLDWTGDALLVILFGLVVVVAVFLPWANPDHGGDVNYSLSQSPGIYGALRSGYGEPVLLLGLMVVVAGILMLARGPRRVSSSPGLGVAGAGLVIMVAAWSSTFQIYGGIRPGVGVFVAALAGLLLIPIGIAAALVGWMVHEATKGDAGAVAGEAADVAADETAGEPRPAAGGEAATAEPAD